VRRLALGAMVSVSAVVALAAFALGDEAGPALPAAEGSGPATTYRVVYEVTGDGVLSTEERVVHRPFDSDIVVRDETGTVMSERASRAGLLATRSAGAEWVLIDVPFSPATGDTRLDRFADHATEPRGDDEVGGRPCAVGRVEFPGEAVASLDRCVDAAGIVLREIWRDAEDEVLRSMTAIALQVGDVDVGRTPTGSRLAAADGNGAVERVDDDAPIPFAQAFTVDPGDGWDFVGRHLVVPPVLDRGTGSAGEGSASALVSDVWRRGPDVVVFDQGATKEGSPPFGDASRIATLSLTGVGPAALTVDDRLAAVNVPLDDGGFLRLSGTLAPAELRRLAETIAPSGGAR
jgi:hypothetical protein